LTKWPCSYAHPVTLGNLALIDFSGDDGDSRCRRSAQEGVIDRGQWNSQANRQFQIRGVVSRQAVLTGERFHGGNEGIDGQAGIEMNREFFEITEECLGK